MSDLSDDGLVTVASKFTVKETIDRLAATVAAKNMTVFARIDHAANAREVGLDLRPTELLIFGSAKAGTPLMQARQAIGLDLPLKALAWQDAAGKVHLTINDPTWLARRHAVGGDAEATVRAMRSGLGALIAAAAGADSVFPAG